MALAGDAVGGGRKRGPLDALEVGAGGAGGVVLARVVLEGIELGVAVAKAPDDLGVGGEDVPGLGEGVLGDLPVGADDLAHLGNLVALLVGEEGEVVGEVVEELLEGLAVGIGVDEDEASPAADGRLGEVLLFLLDVGEVPLAGDLLD